MFNTEKHVYSRPAVHTIPAVHSKPTVHSKPVPHSKPRVHSNPPAAYSNLTVHTKTTGYTVPQHTQSQSKQKKQGTYNENNHNDGWTRIPSQQLKTTKQTLFTGRKRKFLVISFSIVMTLAFWACMLTVFVFASSLNDKYGISIDGQADIVLADETEAQAVLDELTAYYTNLANSDVVNVSTVTYEEDVQVIRTKGPASEIKNKDEAKKALIEGQHLNVIIEGVCKATEDIDFTTETKQDGNILLGTTETHQEGEKGSKDVTYVFTLKNGDFIEKTVIEETVIKAPVPEIILEGTKPAFVSASGQNLGKNDMEMLEYIIKRESAGNVHATNGIYKGIGQLQESHYQTYVGMSYAETLQQPDPYAVQLEAMLGYINGRYGSVQAAYDFRMKNGWY